MWTFGTIHFDGLEIFANLGQWKEFFFLRVVLKFFGFSEDFSVVLQGF